MSTFGSASFRRRPAIRVVLTLFGLGLLVWFAWYSRDELRQLFANCDPGLLAVSIILGVVFTSIQALLFASLVGKHGDQAGSRALASAYLVSQPGKYIPGKVWSLIMQSFALDNRTRFSHIAVANIELAILSTIQAVVMGLALVYADSPVAACFVFATGLIFCAIVSVLPLADWLKRLTPKLSSVLGLAVDPAGMHRLGIPRALGLNAAGMVGNLVASWCVLLAVGAEISDADRVPILASLYLGIAVSILAIPVPAGLGVREAAAVGMGAVLAPTLSASTIISMVLFFRCWQILVDIGCALLGAILACCWKIPESQSRS